MGRREPRPSAEYERLLEGTSAFIAGPLTRLHARF
jgi:hypothetical protein